VASTWNHAGGSKGRNARLLMARAAMMEASRSAPVVGHWSRIACLGRRIMRVEQRSEVNAAVGMDRDSAVRMIVRAVEE